MPNGRHKVSCPGREWANIVHRAGRILGHERLKAHNYPCLSCCKRCAKMQALLRLHRKHFNRKGLDKQDWVALERSNDCILPFYKCNGIAYCNVWRGAWGAVSSRFTPAARREHLPDASGASFISARAGPVEHPPGATTERRLVRRDRKQ